MKNLKKMLAVLVVISMVSAFLVPVLAADFVYEEEARGLYDLGLLKGTSDTEYAPNLGGKLDRQTGVIVLLRLFGQEEEALEIPADEAASMLAAKFTDAADVAIWAQRQVAYAVEAGYVKGLPDGTFAPTADLNGKAYSSLILQQLGYDGDFTYDTAAFDLSTYGGLSEAEAQIFNSNAGINRDSMVGISFATLQGVYKETDKTVIETLVEIGKVDKEKALEIGVLKKEIEEIAELEDVKVAIGETPELPEKVEVTYVDEETEELEIEWPTVDTTEVGEQTVEGKIKGYRNVVVSVKVIVQPAELLVDGLEMNNLVEVVINFNGEVDAGADDVKNYEVDGYGVESASVSDDKNSVTLLLDGAAGQNEELEVTIKTGTGLEEEVTEKVVAIDRTLPEAVSASVTGPNTFEVVFSEPVKEDGNEVLFNDGAYYVSVAELSEDGRTLSIELGASSLKEDTYKISVSGYSDYADYKMIPKALEVEYVKHTEAPTAKIKSATQNKVEIEFNMPVDLGDEDPEDFFYHTYSSWKPNKVTTSDNKVFKLSFTTYLLPEGDITVTVRKEVGDVVVQDKWGNELESDLKLVATIVADKDAPEVTKVEAVAEDEIEVTFSKDVNKDQADNEDNYVIKKDGKEIEEGIEVDYSVDDVKAVITIKEKLSGGIYTIDIKDICDTSVSENKMKDVTVQFEVTDKTAPKIVDEGVTFVDEFVFVTFNEPMAQSGKGSVLEKKNYKVEATKDGKTEEIEIKKIEMFGSGGDKVRIELEKDATADGATLYVINVEDLAGNSISDFGPVDATLTAEQPPAVTDVEVISANEIKITVDKVLDKLNAIRSDWFEVGIEEGEDEKIVINNFKSVKAEDGNTILVAVVAGKFYKADDYEGYTLKAKKNVKSDTGKPITEEEGLAVVFDGKDGEPGGSKEYEGFKDSWAPELLEVTASEAEGNTIELVFDEDIKLVNNDLAASDLVIKDGKDTLVAGKDYTVSASSGDTVTITLEGDYATKAGSLKVSTKDEVNYITDRGNNLIKTFKDKDVKVVKSEEGGD